jgi:hypothetical protein
VRHCIGARTTATSGLRLVRRKRRPRGRSTRAGRPAPTRTERPAGSQLRLLGRECGPGSRYQSRARWTRGGLSSGRPRGLALQWVPWRGFSRIEDAANHRRGNGVRLGEEVHPDTQGLKRLCRLRDTHALGGVYEPAEPAQHRDERVWRMYSWALDGWQIVFAYSQRCCHRDMAPFDLRECNNHICTFHISVRHARGSRCSQGYSQEKCYCMAIKIHIEMKNQFQTRNHTQATHLCQSYKTLCQPHRTHNHTQATHLCQPYTIHLYLFTQTLLYLVMQIRCMSKARAPASPDTASRILHKAPQL